MGVRVYEKGNFYCEETGKDSSESELLDGDCVAVIFDRNGRAGVVTSDCYNEFIHWISDDEDEKYRVERT
jgi:hypothetical protein